MSRALWGTALGCILFVGFLAALLPSGAGGPADPPRLTADPVIRVENGTSVTIWERTTSTNTLTYSVSTLVGPGATHDSLAFEHYTFTSDGTYLEIHCYRPTFQNGTGTGDNIAGARLDGVPGYPGGLYASIIVSYIVGYGGIEASRFNALGPDLTTFTWMGDQDSELVLGFTGVGYPVTLDTSPSGLRLEVDGTPVTAPYALWCDPAFTHVISAPSPQVVGPVRYGFGFWDDGGAQTHGIACAGPATIIAYFTTTNSFITLETSPAGLQLLVDGAPVTAPYAFSCASNSTTTISAPSPQGSGPTRFVFLRWDDAGAQTHDVACTGNATITAFFGPAHLITVDTFPAALQVLVGGTAVTAPYSFWCADNATKSVGAPSPQGTGAIRSVFARWDDGGPQNHDVVCRAPATITASFTVQDRITVVTEPAGLDVEVDGTRVGTPFTAYWDAGSTHTLEAPGEQSYDNATWRFGTWSDGGNQSHDVTVTRPDVFAAAYGRVGPGVEVNWKPFVASAFSVVLLLVGLVRARLRPYPFREPRWRGAKTFLFLSLPFLIAEATTGVASLASGVLAIPPLIGWGTGVDIAILVVGLVVTLMPRGDTSAARADPPALENPPPSS